ncbi:MAG: hypothetical protein JST19_08470 [Bacteroidetes bacterium]|nr:hypothetical protein [Bacteroidota bacterium]
MKNILLFNDFSPEAEHAASLALLLAGKMNVNLYVWNILEYAKQPVAAEFVIANADEPILEVYQGKNDWMEKLESRLHWKTGLKPPVHFIEEVNFASDNVLSVTKKYDAGLLIKGIARDERNIAYIESGVLSCSTKSGCPVMLIPKDFPYKAFEKMVYPTDLRFCRREVVYFLTQIAKNHNAAALIANISAKGLPYMEDNYARTVFEETLLNPTTIEHIYFSNIRERDIPKAIDILVNGMNNDLLVLVNNNYHFTELMGHDTPYAIPENINIPLLIFPS